MSHSKILNLSVYLVTYLIIIMGYFVDLSETNDFMNHICILLLLTLGVIHGSNDLYLQSKSRQISKLKLSKRIGLYLVLIAILVVIFILKPAFALVSFIVYSAFHFGEQQLSFLKLDTNFLSVALYTSLGCLILVTLFLTDYNQVQNVFNYFQLYLFDESTLKVVSVILFILISLYLFASHAIKAITFKKVLEIYFQLGTLFLLFHQTNLLTAFTLYFILWHSLPSIYNQIGSLKKNVSDYNLWTYLRNSSVVYIISITALTLVVLFLNNSELLIKILITMSAAVTLPHILTISQFNKSD